MRAALPPSPVRRRARPGAAVAIALILAAGGCAYRGNVAVELEPIAFESRDTALPGPVALCLSKRLRNRVWREDPRFYSIHLGRKAALAVERLVRASIRDVRTGFGDDCGSEAELPTLAASIDSADRFLDEYGEAVTEVVLTLWLTDAGGTERWRHASAGQVVRPPSMFALDHVEAARDFGEALATTLRETFEALGRSEAVRRTLSGASDEVARTGSPP